jgi:hypothetical protein
MAINVEKIIEEYGQYYLKSGQNMNRLKAAIMTMGETTKLAMTSLKTEETIYQMANFEFETFIQPFRKAFEAKGSVTFLPNKIELQHIKADLSFYPHDIEDNWLGFLAGQGENAAANIQQWPIVRWMLEEYVAKKIEEDTELDVIYNGVRNEAGTTPASCMDGLKKKIQLGAADTDYPINVFADLGDVPTVGTFDFIEEFSERLPQNVQRRKVLIFVAPEIVRLYLKDKRAAGYYNIASDGQINTTIDFTNHELVGLPSMSGKADIFGTFKENILSLTKRGSNSSNFDIQKADREVKFLADWWAGVGFGCNKLVWTTAKTAGLPVTESSGSGSGSGSGAGGSTGGSESGSGS